MKKLSKRLPGAGTNGVMAFTPFTGRGDSVLTNAPARGSTRRVDVQTGAANPPRRASSRNSSRLSLSMSPMMMPIMENEAADWNEPEPGSLVTMTIRNKKSHLYGKTILLKRLKNGLYKIINEDGDTQKNGPKEIVVDLDKALFENFAEDEIKKARPKSSMETHSASLNQSIKTGRSFKSRNTKKSQKKEYIDKLIDLQKNSELLNDYAGNSLSAMSKGKSSSKKKAPKAPEAPEAPDEAVETKAVETKAVETPKAVSIPVSSASDLQDDPEQKASARGYGNAAYDRAIRSQNIKQNNSSNIVADIADTVAPLIPAAARVVAPAIASAGAWLLRNGPMIETAGLLGPVFADLGGRGMEHRVYGDEINAGIQGLPSVADRLTGMVQDAWNGNDVQAKDRERRSKLNADRGHLDGTPFLPYDQRAATFPKRDPEWPKLPKEAVTTKSLAIASLRGTDVKKLKKASVLRGPIPGQDSDAEGYAPQTLNPRTLITPDIGHSIRYHAGDGVMRTEPVSDILERFKSRSKDGKLFASQLDAPPPTIGTEDDPSGSSRRITYTPPTSEVFRADPPAKATTAYDPMHYLDPYLPARAATGKDEWLPSPQGPNTDNPDFDPFQSRTVTKLSVPQEDFSVIDSDSLNQSPTLQYKGRKRQGDGRRFGTPSKFKADIVPETTPSDKDNPLMNIKNLSRRLLHLDSPALEDASLDPSPDDTEGISARDKAVDELRRELHRQFPPEEREAPVTEAAEKPKKQIDDFDF